MEGDSAWGSRRAEDPPDQFFGRIEPDLGYRATRQRDLNARPGFATDDLEFNEWGSGAGLALSLIHI